MNRTVSISSQPPRHRRGVILSLSFFSLISSGLRVFSGSFASAPVSSSSLVAVLPRFLVCLDLPDGFPSLSLVGCFGVVNFNLVPVLGVLAGWRAHG